MDAALSGREISKAFKKMENEIADKVTDIVVELQNTRLALFACQSLIERLAPLSFKDFKEWQGCAELLGRILKDDTN